MSRESTNQKTNMKKSNDVFKWVLVFLLIIFAVYANNYFAHIAWGIRAAVGIIWSALIVVVISATAKGRAIFAFVKGARVELRKVVWPTKQETMQMTLLVIVMVVIVALILWGLDALFFWIVKSLSA